MGQRIIRLEETGSTNDDAKRLAREGAPEGTVIVAERQTAGRGRHGRRWFAPPGTALTFSVILRPPVAFGQAPLLAFLAAAAVREAAEAALAESTPGAAENEHGQGRRWTEPVLVKWPNDVVVGGRKLCGVLVETSAAETAAGPARLPWCVVGVGVNVNQREEDFPAPLRGQATSLRCLAGREFDRERLLRHILAGMERRYQVIAARGFQELLDETRRWSATVGRPVQVLEADGSAWDGFAVDIGDDGALLVRPAGADDGRLVALYAADVSVRPAAAEKKPDLERAEAPAAPEAAF